MSLDLNTLFLVTIYVEAILGLLLLFAWVQNPQIRGVAYWGFAHLLRAGSVVLFGMYGSAPEIITIDLANVILLTTFAVTWAGARTFDGRPTQPMYIVAGAAVWLVASRMPIFSDSDFRSLLSSGIIASYTWLTAYEFWRGRSEALVSRWPAIFMLFSHGALFLLRTPLAAMLPWSPTNEVLGSVWLTALSFEALLFTIAIAFILLAMAKERTELRHKTAAMVDPLTGIANRRAFLQAAAERTAKRRSPETPASAVMLIDLDHFKAINDHFGHAIGDRVLQVFAQVANGGIRSTDLIGRLGGEEFAAVLADVGSDKALLLADRIRSVFADEAAVVDGQPVKATISIGVVMIGDPPAEIGVLLAQADQALYCAKERGRNRVELASLELLRKRGSDDGRGAGGNVDLSGAKTAAA